MDGLIDLARQTKQFTEDGTRSAVRSRLSAAIDELALAEAELAAVHEPASRLAAIIAEAARVGEESAALRVAEEHELGAWLAAGGCDPRPGPSAAAAAAAEHSAALASDAAAARTALPAAEQAFQCCAAKVRDVQRRRDEAVCAAATEAAREFAEEYRTALKTALGHEAVLHGLREELLRCGNRSNPLPGALEAAGHIGEVIAEAKRNASARHDGQPARRLLAALVVDPDARLRKDG
ncbi:MAG TPA: hypothetical protein VL985_00325 [Stellaceae bacterium]|nr:hypothetical protein [Stellaceae bacterium]